MKPQQDNRILQVLIALAVLANFSGLMVPIMDYDAGVYAALSKNITQSNNWLELYFQNNDWLDKPHFPFWVTAVFFEIFGISTWSYKLPGILFILIAAYYTWRFTLQYYDRTVASWAVLILLTAEHTIISSNDVRAEPFLAGLIMGSVYHFSRVLKTNSYRHLLLAALFAGCAIMTKGIFTLFPIGGAVAAELLIRKDWKGLFHPRWLLALLLIIVFISPELYSLWYQFDQHPEKTVFGKNNVSGIKFFLWDSQFGRFVNEAPMKGKGDPFFFFHTLLWAFLPWSLLMYTALFKKLKGGFRQTGGEWFTLGGSLLALLIFSLSRFQLPYYTNIIFPFLAVLSAVLITGYIQTTSAVFRVIQYIIMFIMLAGGAFLLYFYRAPLPHPVLILLTAALLVFLVLFPRFMGGTSGARVYFRSAIAVIILNLLLNWFFYPDLLRYQSASEAAFYLNRLPEKNQPVYASVYAPVFEFYTHSSSFRADTLAAHDASRFVPGTWYVSDKELRLLKEKGKEIEIIRELDDFHVTMLTLKFVNPATRHRELKKCWLIRIR